MTDRNLHARISSQPNILAGKPVIRGTRLSVEFILNLLAHGATQEEILAEYEGLIAEDVAACLLYASKLEALRAEISVGIDEAERGDFVEFTAEQIITEGRTKRSHPNTHLQVLAP